MLLNRLPIPISVGLVLLFASHSAMGCMWGPPYPTVCDKYARAEIVVTGKVESLAVSKGEQKVVVTIDRTFKGKRLARISLYQPLSTCDWDFTGYEGEAVLLYLVKNKETGRYQNDSPGAGGRVRERAEELKWLNGLPGSLNRNRIAGTISLYKDEPFDFISWVSGVKVRLTSEKRSYEIATDSFGVYELWDVAPGKYKILPTYPDDLIPRFSMALGSTEFKEIRPGRFDTDDFLVDTAGSKCGGSDFVVNPK